MQKWLYSGNLVVIGQNWLHSGKVIVFGKSGCIRVENGCIPAN